LIGDAAYNAAQTLLAYGADPNGNARCRPLIIASGGGHTRIVELLLTYSADIDMKDTTGTTPLIQAITCNYVQIAGTILEYNADVNKADNVTN